MSKTSHCVCSPIPSNIESPLKYRSNEMPSPPLPPRTLRTANLSPAKTKWEQFDDNVVCNKEKIQCNCNRPHSCPAEESSPPIPPKTTVNKSKHQLNKKFEEQLINIQKQKVDTKVHDGHHRSSRKSSGRHNSTDISESRRKTRSKSRSLAKDEMFQGRRPLDDERYFMKNHDNLIDKNCELFFKNNKEIIDANAKLCKISESHERTEILCSKGSDAKKPSVPQQTHPPDLIPNRFSSSKVSQAVIVASSTSDSSQKPVLKSRTKKWFNFWSKTKNVTDTNRTTTVIPEPNQSMKITDDLARPRRSKSLHLISSLSPTISMHAKPNVISPKIKAKSSSIFAVISPATTRLKRNFLCISPKSSNTNKKPTGPLSMAANSKSILSDNSQQRPALSSLSGIRMSPVHLMAGSGNTESFCIDKDCHSSNANHYGVGHFNCGASGDVCRGHKLRSDLQETDNFNDLDTPQKSSSNFKVVHSHQDNGTQRKTPLSSNSIGRQLVVNSSQTPVCSCYHYHRSNDQSCSCNNNSYHHFGPPSSQSIVPSTCGCVHNIVQYNTNHFHCCHRNQQLWCWVPCCPEQVPLKQHSFCSCHLYNQSSSPPANFNRQFPPPPPPPPPPVPSFSNNHQFNRRYRQSYSKTPPPSFHNHQWSCHDDHCYQEYNLNQKMILSHQIQSNSFHSNGCSNISNGGGFQGKVSCGCLFNHSKCSACGSLFYDELGSQAANYNVSDMHKSHCINNTMTDSIFDQKVMSQSRMFASSNNPNDYCNCHCPYNHSNHRHSETCGRHSNEMRIHSCLNSSGHRSSMQPYGAVDRERSNSKRRKNSGPSGYGSNIDPDCDEKHDMARTTHHNSPAITTSIHLSPDTNVNCDSTLAAKNNSNASTTGNNMITSSTNIVQNDRKQQQFEPWRKTFHDNMMALRNLGWYWGPLNHLEAENLVQGRPDGTFLVRDSGNEAYFLSLTFRVLGTTYHTRIEYSQGKFSFWSQPESHSATTIVEFIDKAVAHSVSGKFHYFLQTNTPGQPPMEVSLLYPLSRYQIVQSLQHLSRFIILSNIRRDHVSQLQLPQTIKSYLMEKQYYIDSIDSFVSLTKNSEPLTYEPSASVIRTL